jgi:hypothetical protein
MEDFYYFNMSRDKNAQNNLPRILGLTASPIKQQVGDTFTENIEVTIREKLQ